MIGGVFFILLPNLLYSECSLCWQLTNFHLIFPVWKSHSTFTRENNVFFRLDFIQYSSKSEKVIEAQQKQILTPFTQTPKLEFNITWYQFQDQLNSLWALVQC